VTGFLKALLAVRERSDFAILKSILRLDIGKGDGEKAWVYRGSGEENET
jgi:hypothetical protein